MPESIYFQNTFFIGAPLDLEATRHGVQGMELQIQEKEKDKNLIGKLFRKDKRCLLTLDFKPFRS